MLLAVIAALFLAGCSTAQGPEATKTVTVSASPSQPTSAPAAPTTQRTATTPPIPPPGPHSLLAEVDLPAGTSSISTDTYDDGDRSEYWGYTVPYADVVKFLRMQFATGPRYDAYGATSWHNLPPCYSKEDIIQGQAAHQAPPNGWIITGPNGNETERRWLWSDGLMALDVVVFDFAPKPEIGNIWIWLSLGPTKSSVCNRA